jgi:copper chaperone CopZ
MEQIELTVAGMSCTGCEQRIEKVLARCDGVVRSSADHKTGKVVVVFDPKKVSEQSVRYCVERAGYEVSP